MKQTCNGCGATIYLVPTGLHFKWVTNPRNRSSWHCGSNPAFPVRSHSPEKAA